jgi:hypothetical protein
MMKATKLITVFGLVIGFCTAFASRAEAQCGVSPNLNHTGFAVARPMMANANAAQSVFVKDENQGEETIVGLWDVKFISDSQIVDEGFDQYHSDGTEILNDTPPPAAGNVCLGVYEKTGPRTFKLKHPSWIYDPTNTIVVGKAIILETVTVDKGGRTFTGTFIVQFVDLSGNSLGPDLTGQLKGDRITPV